MAFLAVGGVLAWTEGVTERADGSVLHPQGCTDQQQQSLPRALHTALSPSHTSEEGMHHNFIIDDYDL